MLYAIGDIHGRHDLLARLLEFIVDDINRIRPRSRPYLIFCGDYVDRGPDSAAVIAALDWIRNHSPLLTHILLGNHDAMMLAILRNDDDADFASWLRFGGIETVRSYGVHCNEIPDKESDIEGLRRAFRGAVPRAHRAFLATLPLFCTHGDFAFVHAGFRPTRSIKRQRRNDCLWIGDEFLTSDHRFEKIVVHGHSWTSAEPTFSANRISVDTGAYETGVLTAVRLAVGSIQVMQVLSP